MKYITTFNINPYTTYISTSEFFQPLEIMNLESGPTLYALVDDCLTNKKIKHYFTILDKKDKVSDDIGIYIGKFINYIEHTTYFVFYNGIDE